MIWESGPPKQGPLLVMLALADYANDQGQCWPSIKSIAKKSRITDRGTQKILRSLEAEGWICIDTGNGRHGCNKYQINPERRYTPERGSPRTSITETPNVDAETPNVDTPEPLLTINEPSYDDNACDAVRDAKPHKVRIPDDWVPTDDDLDYAYSLQLTDTEIKEIADDFHAYWADRTDAGGKKSSRGWKQTWRNRVRDQAPRYIRNRRMASGAAPKRHGQGSSIASIVAQRRLNGEV
jgi:hypothetical protein